MPEKPGERLETAGKLPGVVTGEQGAAGENVGVNGPVVMGFAHPSPSLMADLRTAFSSASFDGGLQ